MSRRRLVSRGLVVACFASVSGVPATTIDASAVTNGPDTSLPAGRDDGVLRIGVLLPQTGAGNWIGLPGIAAADYAVARVNEDGGFGGEDVELVIRDEGEDAATAAAAIAELIDADVDAVVGPASSGIAMQTLGTLMNAGILTCSPTAASLQLDHFPDRDLFFRTIPSESLQMRAIAQQAQRSGVDSAVIVYADDEYGFGLRDAVEQELASFNLTVAAAIAIDADDPSVSIDELSQYLGSTLIVLAGHDQGSQLLVALAGAAPRLGLESLPAILVNDAVRPTAEQWVALEGPVRDSLQRLGPVAGPVGVVVPPPSETVESLDSTGTAVAGEPPLPSLPFALNTVDCVNLIALSAIVADSDDPAKIAAELRRTAIDGAECKTFAECLALLELPVPRDIDYIGANGQNIFYWFSESGDLGRAAVMTYQFDPTTGLDKETGALIITLAE